MNTKHELLVTSSEKSPPQIVQALCTRGKRRLKLFYKSLRHLVELQRKLGNRFESFLWISTIDQKHYDYCKRFNLWARMSRTRHTHICNIHYTRTYHITPDSALLHSHIVSSKTPLFLLKYLDLHISANLKVRVSSCLNLCSLQRPWPRNVNARQVIL